MLGDYVSLSRYFIALLWNNWLYSHYNASNTMVKSRACLSVKSNIFEGRRKSGLLRDLNLRPSAWYTDTQPSEPRSLSSRHSCKFDLNNTSLQPNALTLMRYCMMVLCVTRCLQTMFHWSNKWLYTEKERMFLRVGKTVDMWNQV